MQHSTTREGEEGAMLDVGTFASEHAEEYGKAIGRNPTVASRKLRSFIKAFLDLMEVNEEETIPVRGDDGTSELLVITKTGKRTFTLAIR